jgi:aconitase A
MYCTQSAVMSTVLGGTGSFFPIESVFVDYISAHTCTKQHIITVISFIYHKVDKGTSQQGPVFVTRA